MSPAKVAKTKTFAGCWSCRRRKVKCDNRRPRCRRCGESCDGYNIDLYWMNEQVERSCAVRRKAMLIVDPLLPTRIDLAKIDRMLEELDGLIDDGGLGVVGAFSAFSICNQKVSVVVDHLSETDRFFPAPLLQRDDAIILGCGTSLYVNSNIGELMHNYVDVVADLLQPAQHTDNPYRSLYIPKAIEAAAGGLFVGASGTGSQAGTALFHALLAVSAFHLHRRQPCQARYGIQGKLHRIKAFEYLRRSLTDPVAREDPQTTMSAMLSMVSVDLMEGGMSDFWIHLDGCNKLQLAMQPKGSERDRSAQTNRLIAICRFMSTLSRSTDPYLLVGRWREGAPIVSADYVLDISSFCADDHSLEYTYGISATLAQYMNLINLRSQQLDYYECRNLPPPASLLRAVTTVHDALTSWSINDEPLASVNEDDHETQSLVSCHILAFHAALMIYFYTRMNWRDRCSYRQNSWHDATNLDGVLCYYNRVCVTNLLAAEALKSSCRSRVGWKAMAPIVWPGFIAACEAEPLEQPLWRTWWTGVQQCSIGSIQSLWNVVQEVWKQQNYDSGPVRPRWVAVLRRNGRRVMSGG